MGKEAGPPWWASIYQRHPNHRLMVQAAVDVGAWSLAYPLAVVLRYDLDPGAADVGGLVLATLLSISLQVVLGASFGLYRRSRRYGRLTEVAALTRSVLAVSAIVFVANLLLPGQLVPRAVPIMAAVLAIGFASAARFVWRLLVESIRRPSMATSTNVLIFGSGDASEHLIQTMLRNPAGVYFPVGIIDDDPMVRNLTIEGVPVLGGIADLDVVASQVSAELLVVGEPTVLPAVKRRLSHDCDRLGMRLVTVPHIEEIIDGSVGAVDLRPVTEAELLGRGAIDTDVESIAGYIEGRRVLVTGAGGSIGSELCRQIQRYNPGRLSMLDRDESALHAVQLSIDGRGLLNTRDLVVCDIRDEVALRAVFEEHRPEVVFHTAALKHVTLLEMYPEEAWKTNVCGSANLLNAAADVGVDRFVNISTDKAADPTSVLGYSKRIAEGLAAEVATRTTGTFLSVRFGNVLGSRGSVLEAFRAQIAAGGPVMVTHPDVTRYFMTVEEAVQLVIQAGAVGRDGEALVLDMGEPVRIAEVAERMVASYDPSVKIEYCGLRQGEKLEEVLLSTSEFDNRPCHPLITHVRVPPLTLTPGALAPFNSGPDVQRDAMRAIAAEMQATRADSETSGI